MQNSDLRAFYWGMFHFGGGRGVCVKYSIPIQVYGEVYKHSG